MKFVIDFVINWSVIDGLVQYMESYLFDHSLYYSHNIYLFKIIIIYMKISSFLFLHLNESKIS